MNPEDAFDVVVVTAVAAAEDAALAAAGDDGELLEAEVLLDIAKSLFLRGMRAAGTIAAAGGSSTVIVRLNNTMY